MQIIISNSSKEPIYEQITNQIKSSIISGNLKEGEALPSMRQLRNKKKGSAPVFLRQAVRYDRRRI